MQAQLKRGAANSGQVVLAHHNKRQKVSTGVTDAQGLAVVVNPHHAVAHAGRPVWSQEVMTPAPSVSALNSSTFFSFILQNSGASGIIEDATIRFMVVLECSGTPGDNSVLPVTQWFERIEFIDRRTNLEIQRIHGDVSHILLNTMSQETLSTLAEMVNFEPKTGRSTSRQFAANEVVNFYLPLTHCFLSGLDLDLSKMKGDLEIKFVPRGSIFRIDQTTLTDATTRSTARLAEVRMIVGSRIDGKGQRAQTSADLLSKVVQNNYLDYQFYQDSGRVMQANSEYAFDLDQFHNLSGALVMLFQKSGPQTSAGADGKTYVNTYGDRTMAFESLGDFGTIDHEDVHGRSLLGEGTPIEHQYFQSTVLPEVFNSDYTKSNNVYVIPFSNDLHSMFQTGTKDGFVVFRGDRERIRVRTGPECRDAKATYSGFTGADIKTAGAAGYTLKVTLDGRTVAYFSGSSAATYSKTSPVKVISPLVGALTYLSAVVNDNSYVRSQDLQIAFTSSVVGEENNLSGTAINAVFTSLDNQPKIWARDEPARLTIEIAYAADHIYYPGVLTSVTPGKKGFRPGVYDTKIYSCYYKHLHIARGAMDVAAD